ncbi:DUF418 domain-containing protein [Herbiconiux liangxiaofengii]|uniref:DUF418 domain-containing protein n=1 Tax=Herbiconiux liangxiaofengii TaxID=3342795 RepID=UPI0035BAF917
MQHTNGVIQTDGPVRRLVGLDAARGLALLGMLAAHTVPEGDAEAVWDGRSSILFATIAGVSLGLLSAGARRPRRGDRGRVARIVALRGVALVLLGMLLTFLQTPIAIILDTYGFLFVVALPLLYAPRWVVAAVAALATFGGPWAVDAISTAIDNATGPVETALDGPWAYFPVRWLIDAYPAPVWLAYLAIGILIARSDVRRRHTQFALVGVGGLAAVLGYTLAAAVATPVLAHDDSTAEVIASGGVAAAVIGLLLWLCDSPTVRSPVQRAARLVLSPLAAAGSLPLTLYTIQILVIFVVVETVDYAGGWLGWQTVPLFFALAIPSLALAWVYRRRFTQGPLEWLLSRITTQRPWPRRRRHDAD